MRAPAVRAPAPVVRAPAPVVGAPAPVVRTPAPRQYVAGHDQRTGRVFVSRPVYDVRGRHYARPVWNAGRVRGWGHRYYNHPGYRVYGSFGLAPALTIYPSLAFLSAGVLAATYYDADDYDRTVYVYIVNEGGQDVEYRVDETGQILSATPVD